MHRLSTTIGISLLLIAATLSIASEKSEQALRVALGNRLFFDATLSADGRVSCATCHNPSHAFSSENSVTVGVHGRTGTRNAPSLTALPYSAFFWEGRAASLKEVVLQPFFNPVEMGLNGSEELVRRIQSNASYRTAFEEAFGKEQARPSAERVAEALTIYVETLQGGANAYDRHLANPDATPLSPEAKRGAELFSGTAGCAECHTVATRSFTDNRFHLAVVDPNVARQQPSLVVEYLRHPTVGEALGFRIESDPTFSELGRFLVTRDPRDIGAFRTPTLRNVALTAPYMHDGKVKTLEEAVDQEIYYRSLQTNRPNRLTANDRKDLVAFLKALTDISP